MTDHDWTDHDWTDDGGDVGEVLRRLPPRQAGPEDRFEQVRARVQRRRRVRLAVVGSATALALAVAIPAGLALSGGPKTLEKVTSPRPTPTPGHVVRGNLTCPEQFGRTQLWVPSKPKGVDGSSRLVPQQPAGTAEICWYRQSSSSIISLRGALTLTSGLSDLAERLTWLPLKFAGQDHPCSLVGSSFQDDYLIGLDYPDGQTVWVSTQNEPNHCLGASNGVFTTMTNLGRQVAASYAAGAWVPEPPPVDPVPVDPDPCYDPLNGRLGQERALVPAKPLSLTVCRVAYQSAAGPSWSVPSGFAALVDAIDRLPTQASTWSCNWPGTQASTDPAYELRFHYATGPDVFLRLQPGCDPELDNGNIAASDAGGVLAQIQRLIAGRTPLG